MHKDTEKNLVHAQHVLHMYMLCMPCLPPAAPKANAQVGEQDRWHKQVVLWALLLPASGHMKSMITGHIRSSETTDHAHTNIGVQD